MLFYLLISKYLLFHYYSTHPYIYGSLSSYYTSLLYSAGEVSKWLKALVLHPGTTKSNTDGNDFTVDIIIKEHLNL